MARLDDIENRREGTKAKTGGSAHASDASKTSGAQSTLRGRDTIYVDVDDDVTSIIGKIKRSTDPVVALVPPAARGALNSVVNLKLISRAVEMSHKRLTLVTTDPALLNLASGLHIPVAKSINAQAKVQDADSEMGDINKDNVIDGKDLSIGDLDGTTSRDRNADKSMSAAVDSIEADDQMHNDLDADGVNDDQPKTNIRQSRRKPQASIPNFNNFRKKLLIGVAVVLLLIGFGVWAVVFAPYATITIKAKTVGKDLAIDLKLTPDSELNVDEGIVSPVVKISKSTETANFEATGEREQGEKAKGSVYICNKQTLRASLTSNATNTIDVPAGTLLYADGVQFVTDAPINDLEGWSDDNGAEDQQVCSSVKATAVKYGPEYNISDGTKMSVQGFSSSKVSASAKGEFTGGTRETVKFVQQSDIDNAVQKLKDQLDQDNAKNNLKNQLGNNVLIVNDSFEQSFGTVKATPSVNQEASGQASVSMEVRYSLLGISKTDLGKILDSRLQTNDANQKIYDNGLGKVEFSRFSTVKHGYKVTAQTTGNVGPQIDENKVKSSAVGKKTEEIKTELAKNTGVSDVDVKMGPFWVTTAPKADKIKVNFTIEQ